jgi:uncharacterized membrane protein
MPRDAERQTTGRAVMRIILAVFYLAAGIIHLTMPDAFMPVMPDWVPLPRETILFTGACELAGSAGLMIPRTRWWAGAMLALYAICVFPVNIKHALMGPPIPGLSNQLYYHIPRLAFQPVLVWWALFAGGVVTWPFKRRRQTL